MPKNPFNWLKMLLEWVLSSLKEMYPQKTRCFKVGLYIKKDSGEILPVFISAFYYCKI